MRLTLLNENALDKELAEDIYISSGIVFASKGTIIKEKTINILKNIGIDSIYIKDGKDDINLKEMIKTPVRIEMINELKRLYDNIRKNKVIDEDKITKIADNLIDNLDVSENSIIPNNIGRKNSDLNLIIHSINVCIFSLIVGMNKNFSKEKLHKLAIGAILHDVGKLFDSNKDHCKLGYEFIKNKTRLPVTSYMCILHHHLYEDGTGYPEKSKNDTIHEFSKIITICNDYINLLQSKEFNLPSLAVEFLVAQSNRKYNKEIFDIFKKAAYCYPNGLYVKLSNGMKGVIIKQNKNFPTRPVVGIIKNGQSDYLSLMEDLSVCIQEVIL